MLPVHSVHEEDLLLYLDHLLKVEVEETLVPHHEGDAIMAEDDLEEIAEVEAEGELNFQD